MAASIASSDGDPGFQIAPMVDVVFVLMLFFMAAVGAQVITKELPVRLPAPHAGAGAVALIVDIVTDGRVLMNDEPIGLATDSQLPELRHRFEHILQTFGDKDLVMLRPAPGIRHERVVDVLAAIQAAGVSKVTFL